MQSPAKRMKSSIPEEIQKRLNCSLWQYTTKMKHYAYNAVLLPCGGNACKQCVEEYTAISGDVIDCNFCKDSHRQGNINMAANQLVEHMIKMFLDELKEDLVVELTESLESLSEDELDNKINTRVSNVENEVELRIESIIACLHDYREDFKKELNSIKRKYKESLKSEELNKMKRKVNDLMISTAETNYEKFFETHRILNEAKLMLEKYANDLNEIKLNSDAKVVHKELIGKLSVPCWTKVESTSEIEIHGSSNLYDCVYWELNNMLIAIDQTRVLIRCNLKTKSFDKVYETLMENPYALCIAKNNCLVVCDRIETKGAYQILEFNQNYEAKIVSTFKYTGDIACMRYDSHDKRNLLYLLDRDNKSVIIIIDVENDRQFKKIAIDRPCDIAFTKEYLYVTSLTRYTQAEGQTGQLDKITHGSNCIFILNRNYETIDKVSFNNWLRPYGLRVHDNYLLTTAYELDRNNVISNYSYLHVIKDKETVKKIKIDEDRKFNYVYFFDNTAVILFYDSFKMIEFSGLP